MILEKIESCVLNGLGYIGRLEKKNGNNINRKSLDIFDINLNVSRLFSCLALLYIKMRMRNAYEK